jgi:excinuclease ABC subunit C
MIPQKPGCYIYKNQRGAILYIGKAKNLKKRVESYKRKNLDEKTTQLMKHVVSTDFIVTKNEVEALILESNLIKKHQPKYNIDLKDAKRYAYIQITDEPFPRLLVARKREGRIFGPFTSAEERDYVIELLRKTFRIRTCKKLPKRPCLRYHIHLCDAPCIGLISQDEYKKRIQKAELILKGKSDDLKKILNEEMNAASRDKEYERAIILREQINALSFLQEKQNMERSKAYDEDILSFIIKDDKVYLMLFNIFKGILANKQDFVFDYMQGWLEDFLMQYYKDNKTKKELILSFHPDKALHDALKKSNVFLTVPKKGEKKDLLNFVRKNIEIQLFGKEKSIEALKEKLKLHSTPRIIECFDISHLSGTSTVGSMVQFRNGLPDKSNYRRFRIRSASLDDTKSIMEIVGRRYKRLKEENTQGPHLIIIDGGKAQLNAALKALSNLELKIPIISIAKRFEEIYVPGLKFPITLKEKEPALLTIRKIRDEAHRFAIAYNRLLRKNEISA